MTEDEINSIHLGEPTGYLFPWPIEKQLAHDQQEAIEIAQQLFIRHLGSRGMLAEVEDCGPGWTVCLNLTPECDLSVLGWDRAKAWLCISIYKAHPVT